MRVRPLINCIRSEIETFLCFLTTGLIFTVLIIIECTSGFYIRVRMVIICFYILSGLDYSESFHMVIYMTQVTCSYVYIIHYLGLSIYVHMLVSRLKSDCDCYFYCTFNTLTT